MGLQGETETDLKKSTLFNRAVAGINDTVYPKLLEAVEAGVADEIENQCLAVTIKNVFGAPSPPEGTTGCGEDGQCTLVLGYVVDHFFSHFIARNASDTANHRTSVCNVVCTSYGQFR